VKVVLPANQTLLPRLKFSKRKSNANIKEARSWYQMKSLARGNSHVKYESPTTHQSNVMTKVNVFEKKVKLKYIRSEGQSHGNN
jgi:hypothetical protein